MIPHEGRLRTLAGKPMEAETQNTTYYSEERPADGTDSSDEVMQTGPKSAGASTLR